MKIYTVNDIKRSIKKVGIRKNDTVFIFPETYKFGILEDIQFHNRVYEIFFKIISEIIGPKGTICIQSYTFDTLRFNKKFYYDKPVSTSGGFSNYILSLKKTVRSNHPAFSIASIGHKSKFISQNNSFHNYGYNSPLEKFLRLNGKILSLGSDYVKNPFNHVAEYMVGVPFYFNKYKNFQIIKNNKMKKQEFASFVRYLDLELVGEFKKLKKEIKKNKIVKSSKLGESYLHCTNANKYYNILLNLLTKDQFVLINKDKYLKSLNN
jgi:aminoglycoside 3-N-acetyltransferase